MRNTILLISLLTACAPAATDTFIDVDTDVETDTSFDTEVDTSIIESTDACRNEVGGTACELTLTDQHGDTWNLSDQHGKVVLLSFSTAWCGPCNSAADGAERLIDVMGADKMAYATVLIEDWNGNPSTTADALIWAELYGYEDAVTLTGSQELLSDNPEEGWEHRGYPTFWIIDENGIILNSIPGFMGHEWHAWLIDAALNH